MLRTGLLAFVVLALIPGAVWAQGDPLGPEFQVNTYTTNNQLAPAVAVDGSGGFVVVWGSSFQDGSFSGVIGQRYATSGSPVGAEFRINTYTTFDQSAVAVAADTSGNFVVVWYGSPGDGSGMAVFGQRYAASGTPLGSEFRINSYTTGDQRNPAVASDPSGTFIVVWDSYGQDGSAGGVFAQRYAGSGVPLGPEFRVNSYVTSAQTVPSVAMNGSGGFVVVWGSSGQDGSGVGVFGQRFISSGTPVGPEFRVNTYTTLGQSSVAVAADPAGSFVAVWCSAGQDGDPAGGGGGPAAGVYGQRYSGSGGAVDGEFRVNTYTTGHQCQPAVATDTAGNFVVVWSSSYQDNATVGVFGQRYTSSGVPEGGEFLVNTYTTSYQAAPSVAADSAGNFVVVWESGLQDGWLRGIYGQRYGPIVPVELMHFRIE